MRIEFPTSISDPADYLDQLAYKSRLPGVQYVAVDNQKIVLEHYAGLADVKNSITMKPGTTMMAYSMTKTFTAAAILQLVEKGALDLDASIGNYLQSKPYGGGITIRQLLSHTSGIPNPFPLRWVHPMEKHDGFDERAALSRVLKEHPLLVAKPGKRYLYSNIGYWLLGRIIEQVTSQSYVDYIKNEIICRLQLSERELDFTIHDKANHSRGYLAKYSLLNLLKDLLIDKDLICTYEENWLHIHNHYVNGPSFGGLVGTALGFAKFISDQLRPSSVLFNDFTRGLFYSQQSNSADRLINMTLGWHIGQLGPIRYFFKEGGGGGYHSEMRIYPFQKIGSVIMVNETSSRCRRYQNWIDGKIIGI